ncbi:MAG: hypothetical protein Q9227_000995 [Pyrenula ochraceoflavens]
MPLLDNKLNEVQQELQSLAKEALKDNESRKKLLGIAMQSVATLESPVETIWRMMLSPAQLAALMTIVKAGLLASLTTDKEPKSAQQLSAETGVEELLIVRLMRPLTALGIFDELQPQTYSSTPISEMLMTPPLLGGFQYMYLCSARSFANLPYYLEKTGYKNVAGTPGPFQDAHQTDLGLFPWLVSNPPMMTYFNNFMHEQRENRKDWYDLFPMEDILLKGANTSDTDAVLLIDVGGGEGHDVEAFHRRFPHHPGKVLLQDLPPTIDNIKPGQLDPGVICMKHNFFDIQPVQGARAYYFRSVFHDWPDSDCIKIMKQTAAAMKRNHSKLLIFDFVLPDMNTPLYPALLDLNMMALLNAMERTRGQWIELLKSAGLKVIKFWTIADDVEGLIEAELM